MAVPNTLARDISPPPSRKTSVVKSATGDVEGTSTAHQDTSDGVNAAPDGPSLAAIEAGEAQVRDHVEYFSRHLHEASRKTPPSVPRLPTDGFRDLYKRNQHARGCHFVIHQHDHPVAGSSGPSFAFIALNG